MGGGGGGGGGRVRQNSGMVQLKHLLISKFPGAILSNSFGIKRCFNYYFCYFMYFSLLSGGGGKYFPLGVGGGGVGGRGNIP